MSEALSGMGSMSMTILIAAVLVIVLVVGLVFWAMRRRGRAFMRGGSNRQPRLAVLDAAVVDDRRRLVLVRRDHVEHLVMIGGPSDIVVERGINRAARQAQDAAVSQAQVGAQPAVPQRQSQRKEQPQAARKQPAPEEAPIAPAAAPMMTPAAETVQAADEATPKQAPVSAPEQDDIVPKIPVTVPLPEPVKSAEPSRPEEPAAEAPRQEKQPDVAPAATAAAVSTALASAADQMAKLEADNEREEAPAEESRAGEPEPAPKVAAEEPAVVAKSDEPAPLVELNETAPSVESEEELPDVQVDEPAPAVEADEPAPEPEKTGASAKVTPVALEDIFDATNEVTTSKSSAATMTADDVKPPAANGNEAENTKTSDAAGAEVADRVMTEDTEESVMSAEELIADFDQLLEAEISKAKQQKPDVPVPEANSEAVSPLQKQTLEDEMKKLLGDLSVKP